MDNTAKELAKYIRKSNDANEDVILRAPIQIGNPIYIENMPPYTKNVEPENALIFKNEIDDTTIEFQVKYTDLIEIESSDYKLLFSFDGINWGEIPVSNDGITFRLSKGDKVMFRANVNANESFFNYISFVNLTAGRMGFVTVTGKILALVSKDGSLQSSNIYSIETPSVFNKFRFRNFEINSSKIGRIDTRFLGLFSKCVFKAISFDCDNYKFIEFSNKENSLGDTRNVAVFLKTRSSFSALFDDLTTNFSAITSIVKIYDTEEPNMLYYEDTRFDISGILDRNIGAKSIFDCGYFFELANNPIKPWTIDEIYNLKNLPYDGNNNLPNSKDYQDIIKHFCGPHYTFYTNDLEELGAYVNKAMIGNDILGYPIMISRYMACETVNNATIYTGILLTTFYIDREDLKTLPCTLFYAPDSRETFSYYHSFLDSQSYYIDNLWFRTLRPCVISQEVINSATSAEIYENTENGLNKYPL